MSGSMTNRFRGQVAEDYEPDDRDEREVEAARTQYGVAVQIAATNLAAADDAEAVAAVMALVGDRTFYSKDALWRHLGAEATRRKGAPLLDSERRQLWRGSHLVWANENVHETPAARGVMV
jgi:hypothetical protein